MYPKLILFYFLIPSIFFAQESTIVHYHNNQIKELISNYKLGQKNKSITKGKSDEFYLLPMLKMGQRTKIETLKTNLKEKQ